MRLVPDDLGALVAAVAGPLGDGVDLVVVTGGLGPTHDDLTMEAVARAVGVGLVVDPAARAMVAERVRHLGGLAPDLRDALLDKQGSVPDGAEVLPPAGTAPGCVLTQGGAAVVALPGPPWERAEVWGRALATAGVAGVLARATPPTERVVRIAGVPESRFVAALDGAPPEARAALEIGVCARDGELEVTLRGPEGDAAAVSGALRDAFGTAVYSPGGSGIAELVGVMLAGTSERLAVAESCTGGLLGARLTEVPGASRWFLGGIVSYDDTVKERLLGVPPLTLVEHGAVSEPTAEAMARGVRSALRAEWSLSVTGIAGPSGGTPDKPVGLVFIGCGWPDGAVTVERHHFRSGDRERIRARAVVAALHLLRGCMLARAR